MVQSPNVHLTAGPAPPDAPTWGDLWFDTIYRTLRLWHPPENAWVNVLEFVLSAVPYTGDETEKGVTGVTSTLIKTHRFTVHGRTKTIKVQVELKTSAGTTGFLEVYVDGGLVLTLSTTATDYMLLGGRIDVSLLPPAVDGLPGPSASYVHLIEVNLRNSDAGGTTTNRLYDMFYTP